jgi:REP element-mobilizing transposase RayT
MGEFEARSVEGSCVNLAYVVMPDHIHWMFQLTAQGELSEIVARTKGRSAHRINQTNGGHGRIWQSGYYDHAIRKEEDIENLANYLIHNPVRAGLVPEPDRYPYWWSTWHARVGPEGPPAQALRA